MYRAEITTSPLTCFVCQGGVRKPELAGSGSVKLLGFTTIGQLRGRKTAQQLNHGWPQRPFAQSVLNVLRASGLALSRERNTMGYHYYLLWQLGAYLAAEKLHREVGFDLVHYPTFVNYRALLFVAAPVSFCLRPVRGTD